jgi:hypothetical protein
MPRTYVKIHKHPLTEEQKRANKRASMDRWKAANKDHYLEGMREAFKKADYAPQMAYYRRKQAEKKAEQSD